MPEHANTGRPVRSVNIASLRANFDHQKDGTLYVRSTEALLPYPVRVTDRLEYWARESPNRVFLAERKSDGAWREITYAQTLHQTRKLASGLLKRSMSPARPLIILSGNSIEHASLALAAMYVGIPYASIAPAYSLGVKDFAALQQVWRNLQPAMAFAQQGAQFSAALQSVELDSVTVVHGESAPQNISSLGITDLESDSDSSELEQAHALVSAESVAKVLYTSGSTGLPKGVITTHRMLCSNQQMIVQVMRCLAEEPPIVCDWLPWNHTFGGSHNFGIVLYNGGTLYIDGGKPTPGQFSETVRNLREIAPTAYFNVPRAYEMLLKELQQDRNLRQTFFSRLKFLFFAAAGLSQHVWDEFLDVAFDSCKEEILVMTGLGATETAPFAISTGMEGSSSGRVGLPAPGVELKLLPVDDRLEVRVRGPNVTPGFWRRPDLSESLFDDEGYYCMKDAVRLVDPHDRQRGFAFAGRLNEEFKLSTGTWVHVGALRMRLLACFGGLLHDVVIAAPDRDYVTALLFPALDACRALCPTLTARAERHEVIARPEVRQAFQYQLDDFASGNPGNSTCVMRAVILHQPPSMAAREVTDKGSINQAAVLKNRAAIVAELYREIPNNNILVAKHGSEFSKPALT